MQKKILLLLLLFVTFVAKSQVQKSIYELNSIDSLLTKDVKSVMDKNLINKRIVFLGESAHHIGSDFLAKTEFVKYLVKQHNYKNIAFESDFFGLYFEHDKKNTFPFWSHSTQCQELFNFLKENNVTIWGFDNQFSSPYTYQNFSQKLFEFLDKSNVLYDSKFVELVNTVMKNGSSIGNKTKKEDINYLIDTINSFMNNKTIKENKVWYQFLESFKSTILQYTSESKKNGIQIRDNQMAKNLDFLTDELSNEKFIVWAANAHISKMDCDFMEKQTMGNQYIKLNPDISYHIAFSPINMPYRTKKSILKQSKDSNNLLSLLPEIKHNYFLDSNSLIENNSELKSKEFTGMFWNGKVTTTYFKHFDALVFIENGERIKYPE